MRGSEVEQNGWQRRRVIPCMYLTVAVGVSTVVVIFLASLEGHAGAQPQGSSGLDIAEYVFGFPWATVWFMVATVFGEWRSVPGGQIAPFSVLWLMRHDLSCRAVPAAEDFERAEFGWHFGS